MGTGSLTWLITDIR